MSDEEFIDAPLAETWRFRDDPDHYVADESVSAMRMSGIAENQIDFAAVNEAKRFREEPATEIELLRQMAHLFLEAHEQDDLWIDGISGAAKLADAHRLAEEWAARFSE